MKITLSLPALRDALALVRPVVDPKAMYPVLRNVRITMPDGAKAATISGTDIDMVISAPVDGVHEPSEAPGPFDVLVPFKALVDMLKASKALDVSLERVGEETVAVCAGSATIALLIGEMNDWPPLNAGVFPHAFSLPLEQARDAFVVPLHAVSTEETRYYLNGICLDFGHPDVITAVATDGHRLTRAVLPVAPPPGMAKLGAGEQGKVIVPRLAVGVVAKLISGKKAPAGISMQLSETRVQIVVGGVTILSKLIDGTFPEYERVIPRDNDHIATVPVGDFAASVKRVSSVSTEQSRPVKLAFGDNFVTLSAHCADNGASAAETLNHGSVTSPAAPYEIGFQARYLLDVMARCGDRAEFALFEGHAGSPAVIHDPARRHVTHVLMPMRM